MTKAEKLLQRFRTLPVDFTWDELVRLLESLDYQSVAGSKTGGSRRRFSHPERAPILLHKPHPGSIVKQYVLRQLTRQLQDEGLI